MYEWIQHVHTYWRHGAALSAWSAGIFLINKWRFPDSESESRSVLSDSLPPHGLCSPWNSLSQNTGWYSLSLLQGIFPTQGSNPSLPHCRWILYKLRHKGNPRILKWVAYPFSRESSWPKNRTGVSCLKGRFFTNWAIREAIYMLMTVNSIVLTQNSLLWSRST